MRKSYLLLRNCYSCSNYIYFYVENKCENHNYDYPFTHMDGFKICCTRNSEKPMNKLVEGRCEEFFIHYIFVRWACMSRDKRNVFVFVLDCKQDFLY